MYLTASSITVALLLSAGRITMLGSFLSVVTAILSLRFVVGCLDSSRHLWTLRLRSVPLPGSDLSNRLARDSVLEMISSVGVLFGATDTLPCSNSRRVELKYIELVTSSQGYNLPETVQKLNVAYDQL